MTSSRRTPLPPQDTLLEYFCYYPDTGLLCYSDAHYLHSKRGTEAGTVQPTGYRRVSITVKHKRTMFMVHRVIWKMITGDDPDTVDHINHDTLDNRLCNLRDVTQADNNKHTRKSVDRGYHCTDPEWRNAYNRRVYAKYKRKGVSGYVPPENRRKG